MTPLSPYDPEIEALWRATAASGARSVAVTSAQPGEGSTMVASALARRAGLAGSPALLVDLNVARPAVASLLALRPAQDEIVNLPALGIGVLASPGPEMLDQWRDPAALAAQIRSWAAAWGLVVFDTVPVLSRSAEGPPAPAVAAAADTTMLVALAGRTPASAIREAQQRLSAAGARLLGTVMNDRDNPPLLAELERESRRLSRLAPATMAALRAKMRRAPILSVRV